MFAYWVSWILQKLHIHGELGITATFIRQLSYSGGYCRLCPNLSEISTNCTCYSRAPSWVSPLWSRHGCYYYLYCYYYFRRCSGYYYYYLFCCRSYYYYFDIYSWYVDDDASSSMDIIINGVASWSGSFQLRILMLVEAVVSSWG
jgi:hypothetical protein